MIWREREIQQELQRSHRNIETFQVVASKMARRGHKRSALECRSKIKTLKRDYRIAKANNSPGKGHLAWLFYDQLDHLLANDTDIPPPDTLPSFSHRGASLADTISQCSTEEEPTPEGPKECSPPSQELFVLRTQSPAGISNMTDCCPVLCIKEEAPDETPVMPLMGEWGLIGALNDRRHKASKMAFGCEFCKIYLCGLVAVAQVCCGTLKAFVLAWIFCKLNHGYSSVG